MTKSKFDLGWQCLLVWWISKELIDGALKESLSYLRYRAPAHRRQCPASRGLLLGPMRCQLRAGSEDLGPEEHIMAIWTTLLFKSCAPVTYFS